MCGTAFGSGASRRFPTAATRPQTAEGRGERRHLTILFCDLVGSTTLAAQVDPEEWRATVAGYQRAAAEAITRFGGEVVRYVGDGDHGFLRLPGGPRQRRRARRSRGPGDPRRDNAAQRTARHTPSWRFGSGSIRAGWW